MHSNEQLATRRGPAALLALLLTVLLGNAGPVAAADLGPAAFTQPQAGKSAVLARTARRDSDEESDAADQPPLWLGASPQFEDDSSSLHPAGIRTAARDNDRAAGRPSPFRARAPPAA